MVVEVELASLLSPVPTPAVGASDRRALRCPLVLRHPAHRLESPARLIHTIASLIATHNRVAATIALCDIENKQKK